MLKIDSKNDSNLEKILFKFESNSLEFIQNFQINLLKNACTSLNSVIVFLDL